MTVEISTFLRQVAETYDRQSGLSTDTQQLLRRAHEHLADLVPSGIRVQGSGGKGVATLTPWVGFFDPDETSSPEEGLYLVYLFSADLTKVNLMLLQGVTSLDRKLGHAPARLLLAAQAQAIRDRLGQQSLVGLGTSADLSSDGYRQKAYAASCVAAITYEVSSLPTESLLRRDLSRFFSLYRNAIAAKLESTDGATLTRREHHATR